MITDYKVIILRGPSGSGKSTFVDLVAGRIGLENIRQVSVDHYFIGDDGVYRFDRRLMTKALASCFRKYLEHLNSFTSSPSDVEGPRIIVDNANLTSWDISPYVLAAQALGVPYVIADLECDAYEAQIERAPNSILPSCLNVVRVDRIPNKGFTIRKKDSSEMFRLEEEGYIF